MECPPARRKPARSPLFPLTLLASAAIGSMAAPAGAAELRDRRLELIQDALRARITQQVRFVDGPAIPNQGPSFRLDVPMGTLREVAAGLTAQTGVTVTVVNDALMDIVSPGVSGVFTLDQALQAVLEGTGVAYRIASSGAVSLVLPSVSESVSVTGAVRTIASPKYTAPLRDIPQTIEVIPRAAMESQGVTTLSEALRNVPGVTLQAGEGGGASSTAGDMFNLRGFNASNSLFVDNVRDDGLVSRDVYNLEQVEVFMGPTGSDVGRGTAAGYVNMQSKTPHLPAGGNATVTLGTAMQRRTTFDFNHQIPTGNPDSWLGKSAVRLNALWQDSAVAGRDEVENETRAIAPSLALGLATPTRVMASAQLLRQDNLPDYGIPGAAWSGNPLVSTVPPTPKPVDQNNYYGSPAYDYDKADQNTYTGRVEHDFASRWTLTNQTRYNRTEREAIISTVQSPTSYVPATGLVTVARQGNIRENEITSNQTALVGRVMSGRIEHSVSSGLEFTSENQFAPTLVGIGVRAPVDIYRPNPSDLVTGYAPTRNGAFNRGKTSTQAIYAFDSVSLGTRLQVNAGLRFEHYRTAYRAIDATGLITTDQSGSDGLISGKAGLVYRLRLNGNLYLSYGTTVTPPGAANFTLSSAPNNQNNPNVDPQRSRNIEAGTKWDFADGRLSVNGSVFHTINENVLYTVDAAAVPPVYNQDDEQEVNGLTFGATGQITPAWSVLASFGYLDTQSLTQNPANYGKRLPLSPEFSGSIWTAYRLPRNFSVGGGVRAMSSVFINAANTIAAPGYHILDGLAEYAANDNLTLRLNLYNLTDAVYIRNVSNNGGRYNPGNPRTATLTVAVTF